MSARVSGVCTNAVVPKNHIGRKQTILRIKSQLQAVYRVVSMSDITNTFFQEASMEDRLPSKTQSSAVVDVVEQGVRNGRARDGRQLTNR